MDFDLLFRNEWLWLGLLIFVGWVFGTLFERLMVPRLSRLSVRTGWELNELLVRSFRGMPLLWFPAGGLYVALLTFKWGQDFQGFAHNLLLIVIGFSITVVAVRIAAGLVEFHSRKVGGVFLSTSIFANITRILIFIVGVLIILQSLGISIAPLLTALGVGGLAVALALQDTLSNLFSGIQVIVSKQIRPGDYVRLASGEEGYVTDIAWRYTTLRALPNNRIILPNSKLASAIVTNYHFPEKEMAVLVKVGVSYGSDLERVERVTVEVGRRVMEEVQGGVAEFEPFVRYHTFGDSSIDFTVILRAREFVDQYLIKHEFVKRLHKRYREEGIQIPFPIRTVMMEK